MAWCLESIWHGYGVSLSHLYRFMLGLDEVLPLKVTSFFSIFHLYTVSYAAKRAYCDHVSTLGWLYRAEAGTGRRAVGL